MPENHTHIISSLIEVPLVSILLATYNESSDRLARCVDSIINQTYSNWEIVIVLEPQEKNIEYFAELSKKIPSKIRVVNSAKRLGLSGSLAHAVEIAQGEFIARLDSDDYAHHERLSKQVKFLRENPQIFGVGSWLEIVSPEVAHHSIRRYPATHNQIKRSFLLSNSIAHPTIMLRRVDLAQIGSYDPDFRFAEDLELWLRAIKHGLIFANIQECLVYYNLPRQEFVRTKKAHWQAVLRGRWHHSLFIWPFWWSIPSLLFWSFVAIFPSRLLKIFAQYRIVTARLRGFSSEH